MRNTALFLAVAMLFVPSMSCAGAGQSLLLETTQQSRERHSAQNYETYQQNGYQAPLGGYQEKLGDPAPYGTSQPGYNDATPSYQRMRMKQQKW